MHDAEHKAADEGCMYSATEHHLHNRGHTVETEGSVQIEAFVSSGNNKVHVYSCNYVPALLLLMYLIYWSNVANSIVPLEQQQQ